MGTLERNYIKKGKMNQYVERYSATDRNGSSDNETIRRQKKKYKMLEFPVLLTMERVERILFWNTSVNIL